jgi:hypothetical protein
MRVRGGRNLVTHRIELRGRRGIGDKKTIGGLNDIQLEIFEQASAERKGDTAIRANAPARIFDEDQFDIEISNLRRNQPRASKPATTKRIPSFCDAIPRLSQ